MQGTFRHPAQGQVLLLGGVGAAAGVAAHDVGQPPELVWGYVPPDRLDVNDVVAGLLLGDDVSLLPVVILAAAVVAVAGNLGGNSRQFRRRFPVDFLVGHQRLRVNGANLGQFRLYQLAELIQADAVNQHLEPGHHPVFAEGHRLVKDGPDRQGQSQVVRFGQELIQRFGQTGHYGSAAAHENLEAALQFAIHLFQLGNVGQVLDGGGYRVSAVDAGEGGLELAGKCLSDGMAYPEPDVGGQIGRGVEDFCGVHAGGGRPDHVADGVAAGFPAGQAHLAQQPQYVGTLGQRYVVKLDILPGGDVPLAQRRIMLGHFAQGVQGVGVEDASGDFNPNHLHVGLPLTVHSLPEAEGGEHSIVLLAGLEAGRFRLETLNLILHKRHNSRGGRG